MMQLEPGRRFMVVVVVVVMISRRIPLKRVPQTHPKRNFIHPSSTLLLLLAASHGVPNSDRQVFSYLASSSWYTIYTASDIRVHHHLAQPVLTVAEESDPVI